ncbi:hypothetical protein, partial [Vibrio jasicida]|uniref:hypothetical protein n=1 Tax=Vibrio jasicida TaxID=766224 RepID=UPI001C616278
RESMFDFDGGARAASDRCAGHPQAGANDLIIQAIWAECAGDDLWGSHGLCGGGMVIQQAGTQRESEGTLVHDHSP